MEDKSTGRGSLAFAPENRKYIGCFQSGGASIEQRKYLPFEPIKPLAHMSDITNCRSAARLSYHAAAR
jgi:hypothetical protein